jgi:uncharacterized protein YegL
MASLSVWVLSACGPSNLENPPCLSLTQPNGATLSVSKPAKVSVLFQVDSCQGEAMTGLDASAFSISENDEPVNALEGQRSVIAKGKRHQLSTALLLDVSGSLLRSGQLPALIDAAKSFASFALQNSAGNQQLSILTFDGRAQLDTVVPFTSDLSLVNERLDALNTRQCQVNADCASFADRRTCAGSRCVDDSTNLYGALIEGLGVVADRAGGDTSVAVRESAVVLFTDGSDQAARVTAERAVTAARSSSTRIFTVGFGPQVDNATLRQLGKDGTFSASSTDQLRRVFEQVAQNIARLANRYYLLEYCSPKRSGRHSFKISARVERGGMVMLGGLSGEFDASGFSSGCSLTE